MLIMSNPGVQTATPAQPRAALDPPAPWPASQGLEEVWLLGQPPLSRLLDFVESAGVEGDKIDRAA